MSLRDELRSPFRGGRDLLSGSAVLARLARRGVCRCALRVWSVAWRGESFADRLETLGVAALVGVVGMGVAGSAGGLLVYAVAPYAGLIGRVAGPAGAACWVVAALVAAPPRETATLNDHEKSAGEKPTETDPQPNPHRGAHAIVRHVITAVAQAETDGYRGVHLAELLDQLRADDLTQAEDVAPLRTWLEAAGIPCNRNLKRGGKGPTWGVRVDDLTAVLGRPLRDALLALDQPPAEPTTQAPVPAALEAPAEAPPEAAPEPSSERHLTPGRGPSPEAAA